MKNYLPEIDVCFHSMYWGICREEAFLFFSGSFLIFSRFILGRKKVYRGWWSVGLTGRGKIHFHAPIGTLVYMRLVNGVGQVLFQLILITAGNLRDMASHCFYILIILMYHDTGCY